MKKGKRKIMFLLLFLVLVGLLAGLFFMNFRMLKSASDTKTSWKNYEKHYVFISNSAEGGEMWKHIYEGAEEAAESQNIYVEWLGTNLVENYSEHELMEIAIDSSVDGIIVESDDSSEMNELTNRAVELGIPIVTVVKDCYGSYRQSFIGISAYNLGQQYGNLVVQYKGMEKQSVLVVINSQENDNNEKLTYAGLRETLTSICNDQMEVSTLLVDGEDTYSIENSLRDYFVETTDMPDFIVCLDEQTTEEAASLIVDYNRVGQSKIIGFYKSESTLKAIQNGVMEASVTVDAKQLGKVAVQALMDYADNGYVSDYIPMETDVITKENADEYEERGKK